MRYYGRRIETDVMLVEMFQSEWDALNQLQAAAADLYPGMPPSPIRLSNEELDISAALRAVREWTQQRCLINEMRAKLDELQKVLEANVSTR